jgi:uncharacterized protein YdcH (DUF465 family)
MQPLYADGATLSSTQTRSFGNCLLRRSMTKQYRTTEQILQVYRLDQVGTHPNKIAEELGIPKSGVVSALMHIKKYMVGKHKGQERQSQHYLDAVRIIKREARQAKDEHRQPSEVRTEAQRGNYAALREASETFQQAIAHFIRDELATRHSDLQAEVERLREENQKLKDELESIPKTVSWIDELEDTVNKEK